jgi:predicted O-methyltransferase YrrM
MDFLPHEIDDYAGLHTKPETGTLAELNRETYAKVLRPRMLSGHIQGKILEMFSYMIRPERILEIGTYTGYSAICLAQGLAEGGMLHTIDINDELEKMVRSYFEKAGVESKIQYHVGDAVKIIPDLNETWDLVFIDADKENYARYYDMVFDAVRPGGYIIADNVLWSGKVVEDPAGMDEETRSLRAFNKKIQDDSRVDNVLMPVRDGLMVVRKK